MTALNTYLYDCLYKNKNNNLSLKYKYIYKYMYKRVAINTN